MQHIHRYKVIGIGLLFLLAGKLGAQGIEHNPLHDHQRFHFGFSIVPNYGKAKVVLNTAKFYGMDSIQSIRPQGFTGFGFGGIADCRINKYMTVMYMPQIQFSQRNFLFTYNNPIKAPEVAKTETVALDQCLLLKYHSVRHGNTRFYLIGGGKFSFDFQSDETTVRAPYRALVPFKQKSFYYDFGFGIEHFGLYAVISTEIKMSNSITNMLSPDPYIYTSTIDRIQSRLLQISFHFQN